MNFFLSFLSVSLAFASMRWDGVALRWVAIGLSLALALHAYDSHSLFHPSSIQELFSLPLPARAVFSGEVRGFHLSGESWVFEMVNGGSITCYFRHPPSTIFPFNHEMTSLRARIELTPRGRLCVVEEWLSHAPSV